MLAPKEAILGYQISTLRDLLSKLKFKKGTVENILTEKLQILNSLKLQGEKALKETSIKVLKASTSEEITVTSDDAKSYLLETWKIRDAEENEVNKIQDEIKLTQCLTRDARSELERWRTYSDVTKKANETRIQMLETDLANMEQRFQSMVKYLSEEKDKTELDIRANVECSSENIRNLVVKKVIDTLNKFFSHQMLQNKWLKIEKKSLEEKLKRIIYEVENLQGENLAAIEEIFNINLTHLFIPISFCETQITDDDNLHKSTVLDLKIDQDLFDAKKHTALRNPEHKDHNNEKHLNTKDEIILSSICSFNVNMFHHLNEDENPSQTVEAENFAALGPLEKNACFLQGLSAKISQPDNFCSAELQAQLKFNPELENWPVSRDMLLKYLSNRN